MNENKKSIWKLIFLVIQSVAEAGAAGFLAFKGTGLSDNAKYQCFILAACMCVWLIISVFSVFRYLNGRRMILAPCIGIQVFVLILGISASAFLTGITRESMMIWAAGVLCEIAIIAFSRYYQKKDEEELLYEDTTPELKEAAEYISAAAPRPKRDLSSLCFDCSAISEAVTREYCLTNDTSREQLDSSDMKLIKEFSCTPVSYLFLWAAKRGFLSSGLTDTVNITSLLIDGINPAVFIAEQLDGKISINDFSPEIRGFINEYYTAGTSFTGDQSRKYEFDYYIQIRNPWKVYYCLDYSAEIYQRFEERIEESYQFFRCRTEWYGSGLKTGNGLSERRYSEALGHNLEVFKAPGLYGSYADKCIKHACSMSDEMKEKICSSIISDFIVPGYGEQAARKYLIDRTSVLKDLNSGSLIIPVPYGEETAYILCFEAEFEKEHGIGIVIRDNEVISVSCRMDADSPWTCDNDYRFRAEKSLCVIDIRSVDALGKALRAYSDGSLEQGIIVPEFTGARVPEENRLFVTLPAAELKNRTDIIAEKMFHDGTADRYECKPVYRNGSFVPSRVLVSLYKAEQRVFFEEIFVW